MSTLVIGDCSPENIFSVADPDAISEAEFEFVVANTLMCVYPTYHCFPFGGTFKLDGDGYRPDLALVARDFSHWFVIEVELTTHSFEHHVLPQVRALRYGEPQGDCLSGLAKGCGVSTSRAQTLLKTVPRSVAVIANRHNRDWDIVLRSHNIQFISSKIFRSGHGKTAVEFAGHLEVFRENLGFGIFSATDRALRFFRSVRLPDGEIQIDDQDGSVGLWLVTRDDQYAWITKVRGTPALGDGDYFQLVITAEGRVSLRRPPV